MAEWSDARRRDAPLATLDRQLLDIGLGITPDQLLKQLTQPGTFLDSKSL